MNTPNLTTALLALALFAPAAVMASPPAAPDKAAEAPVPAEKAPSAQAPAGSTADASRLEATRGGDAAMANEANLSGTVAGNSAVNVTTGSNIIDAGSFAGASGMPMVIQNSGANVLIQNATVINVQLR